MALQSFKCSETEALYRTGKSRRFGNIASVALRKLDMLHGAGALIDLRAPPGNRLEALTGNRSGQHSIRINKQWRLCFVFGKDGAEDVEISKHYE